MTIQIGAPTLAKFHHDNGTGLRLQCFLLVRDEKRRVACLRLEEHPDHWLLPGEMMRVNEDPKEAALRVAKTWFQSPLAPKLSDVLSFPAETAEDKWYVLFAFEAEAPADLEVTPDTLEVRFVEPGNPPGPFGFDHASVFGRIRD